MSRGGEPIAFFLLPNPYQEHALCECDESRVAKTLFSGLLYFVSLLISRYDNWVLKATWPWALPADLIRAYFGEKVALFFAFTAHYTPWLLPLALLGFVTQMQILQNGYDDAFLLFAFSACTSVWSIFMLESWKRKEWHHTVTWGMSNYATAESERPQFHGVLRPSLVDGEDVIYYPAWAKRRDFAWSSAVTLFLIVLNLVLQIFIFGFRKKDRLEKD